MNNGVDVANVTPSFSNEEWNKLGNNGCSYVQRERKILSRCHRGGAEEEVVVKALA